MNLSLCQCRRAMPDDAAETAVNEGDGDHAGVHVPPPLIHLAAIGIALGMSAWFPLAWPMSPLLALPGIVLLLLSFGIAATAFRHFTRHDNPVAPNRPVSGLMETGPFRYTRNPLYLALALLHAGIGLVSANAWILLALAPTLLIVRYYAIAREEAYLMRRFGEAYREYQRRVRRWF